MLAVYFRCLPTNFGVADLMTKGSIANRKPVIVVSKTNLKEGTWLERAVSPRYIQKTSAG